ALREILVDLAAEVVRFHLHVRRVLHRMEADEVDVQRLQRRGVLECACADFQGTGGGGLGGSGRVGRRHVAVAGAGGEGQAEQRGQQRGGNRVGGSRIHGREDARACVQARCRRTVRFTSPGG